MAAQARHGTARLSTLSESPTMTDSTTTSTRRSVRRTEEARNAAVSDWLATVGCRWAGHTTASVAQEHGVSAKTLRRWIREYQRSYS
jgi:hypothetical protein